MDRSQRHTLQHLRRLWVLTQQIGSGDGGNDEDASQRAHELLGIQQTSEPADDNLHVLGLRANATAAEGHDEVVLRSLEPDDYRAVSTLNAHVFAKPYPERVEQWLSSIPPESWDTLCAFAPDGQLVCSFW